MVPLSKLTVREQRQPALPRGCFAIRLRQWRSAGHGFSPVQHDAADDDLHQKGCNLYALIGASLRRARTAAARPCSTGTVCAMLMHASVTDTPYSSGVPGAMSCRPSLM